MECFFCILLYKLFLLWIMFFFSHNLYIYTSMHEHMIVENVHVINSASPNMSDTVLPERS